MSAMPVLSSNHAPYNNGRLSANARRLDMRQVLQRMLARNSRNAANGRIDEITRLSVAMRQRPSNGEGFNNG